MRAWLTCYKEFPYEHLGRNSRIHGYVCPRLHSIKRLERKTLVSYVYVKYAYETFIRSQVPGEWPQGAPYHAQTEFGSNPSR